jgi:hypothetical protein
LGAVFTFLFFNGDEAAGLKLKTGSVDAYKNISGLLKSNVAKIKTLGALDQAVDNIKDPKGFLHLYGDNLIRRMLKDGNSIDDVVAQAILTSTAVINLSPQVFIFFLSFTVVCPNGGSLFIRRIQCRLERDCTSFALRG